MKRNNIKIPDSLDELGSKEKLGKKNSDKAYIPYHMEKNEKG